VSREKLPKLPVGSAKLAGGIGKKKQLQFENIDKNTVKKLSMKGLFGIFLIEKINCTQYLKKWFNKKIEGN